MPHSSSDKLLFTPGPLTTSASITVEAGTKASATLSLEK